MFASGNHLTTSIDIFCLLPVLSVSPAEMTILGEFKQKEPSPRSPNTFALDSVIESVNSQARHQDGEK